VPLDENSKNAKKYEVGTRKRHISKGAFLLDSGRAQQINLFFLIGGETGGRRWEWT